MSIEIKRIGGDPLGVSEYSLSQNGKVLTTFSHNRPDDLKECLLAAAESVARARWEKTGELYSTVGGG